MFRFRASLTFLLPSEPVTVMVLFLAFLAVFIYFFLLLGWSRGATLYTELDPPGLEPEQRLPGLDVPADN